ncbi:MAG: hypothetical protein LBF60_03495 [Treponema sp.]|jgi:hypothetical protein|nr:hypothetical protein [Treponema sp.]
MHTSPFFAKSSAKFLSISLQALFIATLFVFFACSSIGVSGMYATNTAVPPSSTKARTEDAEKLFGGTLFTDATALGSEISYFTGENALTGNKVSGVDFGLAFKIPISIKRVTITPFVGADYRHYLGGSMQQVDSETDISDVITENMWLKTGLSIDYAFTNTFFLRAEAGYGRQMASDKQKELYSSDFFAPGYGLKFRIGFGTYVGSAKKNFSKKKPAAASKSAASTTPPVATASPSKPPAAPTATTTPVPDTPSPSKKTTNSGTQIYIGETYKCQFSSQDTFQLFALKDIPSRYSSLTIFTDGVKDTMIAIITIEGAQAIVNQGTVQVLFDDPDRYILALDDDSGKDANANVTVNVPRERAFIVMVLNKDKSAGNYTLTVNGNEGSRENDVEVLSPSEKTPIIYANKTYERTFTSSDSSIHLYGLSDVASYNSLTIYTEGRLDTGLLIISANGAQTLVDTGGSFAHSKQRYFRL